MKLKLTKIAPAVAMACALATSAAQAQTEQNATATASPSATIRLTTATQSIYDIEVEPMEAEGATTATTLQAYKGKVLLIVNVASNCGYTKQYAGLQELFEKYERRGLVVLGFPSNDFKDQEPGTDEEILEFCTGRFGVSFPMFSKVTVTGENKAPLYKYLTEGDHAGKGEVKWNFNKFLVSRTGEVIAHYESKVTPQDTLLVSQIELLLAQGE